MENASKALIIAGAILLAILLITLGIFVFTQAQDTLGSINLSEQEVLAFNNKFLAYEGYIRGSQVKQLINLIDSNNKSREQEGATDRIINYSSNSVKDTEHVKTGSTYYVQLKKNKGALIDEVNITLQEKNDPNGK